MLLDARQHQDALVLAVGVAHEVDAGGERQHRLARPAGTLDDGEPALSTDFDGGLDAVDLFWVRRIVAEHLLPLHARLSLLDVESGVALGFHGLANGWVRTCI